MTSHDYDFDDFLRSSKIAVRLYNNNFAEPQNASPAYRVCGDRLLILSACLRLLHDEGSSDDGLFSGNVQAQVKRYVPAIGDFRRTIRELGALIRNNSGDGRPTWEAIAGDDLTELEKLSSSMRKQNHNIHDLLVLDRSIDVNTALEILGRGAAFPNSRTGQDVVELPASFPDQMARLGISEEENQYRNGANARNDHDPVSPVSPNPHILNMANVKIGGVWGAPDTKYLGMGPGVYLTPTNHRIPVQNQEQFYGIARTNSMSNSSDAGRSGSDSSSRNNSSRTLDSPGNSSPAQSPTYYISHTGNSHYFREKDKVRLEDMAQISGMRIRPGLGVGPTDSPNNISGDFSPHSPSASGLSFQSHRAMTELGHGSMRIPRRPVATSSNSGGPPVLPSLFSPHNSPFYENSPRPRPREPSFSEGSIGQSSESSRGYSSHPSPPPSRSELANTNAILRRESDVNTIMPMSHRGSETEPPLPPIPRSRQATLELPETYSLRNRSRSNSFNTEPYMDAPFSPDTIAMNLNLSQAHRTESISSKDSKGEENLRPGEIIVFKGKLQSANTVDGPYDPSELRVYKNPQTDVFRFVTTVLDNPTSPMSHSQYFRPRELELVPEYGYDPVSKPILWLREIDDINKSSNRRPLEITMADREIPILPVYRFANVPEMLDFQSAVLGEICYLDIETVRFLRLKGAAKETRRIDNTRVQLWHPAPSTDRRGIDDGASFMTVGTTRTHANPDMVTLKWSRMVIYLGRSNDFVTVFITDDITIKQSKRNNTLVFEPTKYTGRALFKSRDGIKAKVIGGGNRKGGLRLDLKGLQPDDEENFPMFKTFEIEFEDAESLVRFMSVWNQLIQERRRMRGIINKRKQLAEERMMMPGGGGN